MITEKFVTELWSSHNTPVYFLKLHELCCMFDISYSQKGSEGSFVVSVGRDGIVSKYTLTRGLSNEYSVWIHPHSQTQGALDSLVVVLNFFYGVVNEWITDTVQSPSGDRKKKEIEREKERERESRGETRWDESRRDEPRRDETRWDETSQIQSKLMILYIWFFFFF